MNFVFGIIQIVVMITGGPMNHNNIGFNLIKLQVIASSFYILLSIIIGYR